MGANMAPITVTIKTKILAKQKNSSKLYTLAKQPELQAHKTNKASKQRASR
jgi:hypothetical protein